MQVWWARLGDARPGLRALLDPVERGRYESTVDPAGRGRFLVGCALGRLVLGDLLGLPPEDVPLRRVCPRCGGPHGKVHLALPPEHPPGTRPGTRPDTRQGPHPSPLPVYDFSVTHSGALVGVAVCRDGEVGLDVEECLDDGDGQVDDDGGFDVDSAARVALSDAELAALYARPATERRRAFLRTWTRKEAVLKALGVGLGAPLRELEVSEPERPPAVLAWPDRLAGRSHMSMADLLVDGVHPAAVAVAVPVAGATAGERRAAGRGEVRGEARGEVRGEVRGDGALRVAVHDGSEMLTAYDP